MTRFRVINGTPAPDTPKERVRKRLRATSKPRGIARCTHCTGHALVTIELPNSTGGYRRVKCCAICFSQGHIRQLT